MFSKVYKIHFSSGLVTCVKILGSCFGNGVTRNWGFSPGGLVFCFGGNFAHRSTKFLFVFTLSRVLRNHLGVSGAYLFLRGLALFFYSRQWRGY